MKQLKLSLQHEQAIVLQGNYGGSAADFSTLARLTHTELLDDNSIVPHALCEDLHAELPTQLPQMFASGTVDAFYDPERRQCRVFVKTPERLHRHRLAVFIWQMSVTGGAAAAIQRGNKAHLMHCSMLEKSGRALLLCGESGIGKSTSVRRYKAAGGEAVADDMIMLEHAPDGKLYAYRLPTWSACREDLSNLDYPFSPPLEVSGILAISRGLERESLESISPAEFYAQLYRCSFFHYLWNCGNLPAAEKTVLAGVLKESVDKMTAMFPPRAFMAHLQGNIAETLGAIL